MNRARFTYSSSRQSDIANSFDFHETSHMRSFAKIKLSRKFPNLQYKIANICSSLELMRFMVKSRLWDSGAYCIGDKHRLRLASVSTLARKSSRRSHTLSLELFVDDVTPDPPLSPASMQSQATIGPPAKRHLNGVSLAGR